MTKKMKVYAAGIADRQDDWAWQGTVAAESANEAKKLLAQFKRENFMSGRCEVTTFHGPHYTNRKKGVSNSTYLS